MFKYQSLFRRQASGEAPKIISLSVVAVIAIMLLTMAAMFMFSVPMFFMEDAPWLILYIFVLFFLLLLFSLFVLYPLSMGIIRFFTQAYNDREYGLGEIFFVFRQGRYGKAIKLTLLVILLYIVVSVVIGILSQLIFMVVNLPFSALIGAIGDGSGNVEQSLSAAGGQLGLFIVMLIVNFLVMVLVYVPYILIAIYMFLIYLAFIDQPHIPTLNKFKIAWDVMFRAKESVVKLFFSNIFLIIGIIALYFILALIGALVAIFIDSPTLFVVLMIISFIIFILAYIYVIYLWVGSVVAYYFSGRQTLDERARELGVPFEDEAGTQTPEQNEY